MSLTPWTNHSWHVPLYVDARGLTTSTMFVGSRAVEVRFDFIDHRLHISTSADETGSMALTSMPVASFYREFEALCARLSIPFEIWTQPVEIPDPCQHFDADYRNEVYDGQAATSFWRALVGAHRVFARFRASFVGKASPVHFFWGSGDLAVTRFSGRTAPLHPGGAPNCADWVMQEAYSHELSSAGLFAGQGVGEACFYSYAYPAPEGFAEARIEPESASFNEDLGEFLLPYEAVRTSDDPDATLLRFLESTYAAAADLGHWDRSSLEANLPDDFRS